VSFKNAICISFTVRIFVLIVGIGLVFFRCIKSVEVTVIGDPMVYAASMGQVSTVSQLLKNGYSANVADDDGNSPLSFVVWNVDYHASREVLEILLGHQVHVRFRNRDGQTALQQAVKITNQEMRMRTIGKLIKFGSDINARDNRDYTLLEKNIETYDTIGTDMILDWWGKLILTETYEHARKRAKEYDMRDVLVVLDKGPRRIKKDAHWNPGLIDKRTGLNDLHIAVINGDVKLIDDILKRNVSVNIKSEDEYGMGPLHYAVLHYKLDVLRLLLEHKANVQSTDRSLNTPLHMVAWLDDINMAKNMVDALVKCGANINARNKNGDTLLHMLIYNNNKDLITYVNDKYRCDVSIKNNDRETPISLAQRLNRKNLLKV
jgi:ankyrin repeat protein